MSCTGGKQECADTIECLRYPERVFEHRYLCWWGQVALEVKIHTEKLTGDWKGFCDKTVLWGAQSYILPASGLCFQPLLLCTKTSKERNHNTGALNVSAATFLLGSNSFQRNDTVFVFCSDFQKAIAVGRPAVLGSANSLLPFVTASVCSALCLEPLWFYFFPPTKEAAETKQEKQVLGGESRSVPPRFPSEWELICTGTAAFMLDSCTCWAEWLQGVYVEVCFWDVCPVLNVVYFSPAPGSLTKLCCQNLPPLLFLSTLF